MLFQDHDIVLADGIQKQMVAEHDMMNEELLKT